MTTDEVRTAIEQYVCVVAGIQYRFRLEWCATERFVEPVSARTLFNIECIATADSNQQSVPLHVVVWLTDPGELRSILQDALHMHVTHDTTIECASSLEGAESPAALIASTLRLQ
jgi:hypothetical protein